MSVRCDGVGGIVNGGDEKMGEEVHHRRSDAATIIMVVNKSTIGGPYVSNGKFPPRARSGPPGNMHLPAFRLLNARE